MSEIVISGYHGFANSGDEALLWAILNTLRKKKPDITVTVLSKTPEETAKDYGVTSVYRYNCFKVRREMKKAKLLLFGGGSLLQDVTSAKSIKYYLGILHMAQSCGIKTMLYANGIGPIDRKFDRYLAKKVLNKVDVITLRDDRSDEELKKLNVTKPKIIITADPAFTIETDTPVSGEYFRRRAGVPDHAKVAVISLRGWKKTSADFTGLIAALCDYMIERYDVYPLFVPMQYPADTEVSLAVIRAMRHTGYLINRALTVPEMFSVLSDAELVIGMRLHSLIYATTLEIPAIALVYDPKISAFMESLSQPGTVDVEKMTLSILTEALDKLMASQSERKRALHEANAVLKKKAEENAEYAVRLLEE